MSPIRLARAEDLQRLTEIYNDAIAIKFATAHTEEMTSQERQPWFDAHQSSSYPIFVYDDGLVKGYGSLSPYRVGRQAFSKTAEISYYVDFNFHRKGIARQLIDFMTQHCTTVGINCLVAFLFGQNSNSISLLKKQGYEEWGKLPTSAVVDGTACDHVIYGKKLKDDNQAQRSI